MAPPPRESEEDAAIAELPRGMEAALLVTGGYDHTIRIWNPDTCSCKRTLQHGESQINALEITPDRNCIAAAGYSDVRMYDLLSNTPTSMMSFQGHVGNVTAVTFSKDGSRMYTGGDDETVKVFDVRSTPDYKFSFDHGSPVTCVALHPNQFELISGDQDGKIVRWDLRANNCAEHLIPELDVGVRSVSVSPDGRILSAINDEGHCYIWELEGKDLRALKQIEAHHPFFGLKCMFSPDSKKLATTSSDKTARIWDVDADFELKHTLEGHTAWVWDCAFSADSSLLVTGSSDSTARVWDLDTGESVLELKGHQRSVTSVALSD
eukprot:m.76126 g.76126  ORF g.76126 m.76126 type:complete len:322 (+) comp19005_c0_seq1:19-984(+)